MPFSDIFRIKGPLKIGGLRQMSILPMGKDGSASLPQSSVDWE